MTDSISWLPALALFEDYGGDWNRYLDALYAFFKQDFIDSRPVYNRVTLALKRHPVIQNKEATFWHIISEGDSEADRVPDMRRCERIRWPRPVIEHSGDTAIKIWANERRGEKRICLWLEDAEYLVILAERKGYILLWTAYTVVQEHSKKKLRKEYAAARNS
jgi:hypothetical protein